MYTENDEGKGLVKCYWKDVREKVSQIEPQFAALVDKIGPGKDYPLFKAYYPYGMHIGDTETAFMPLVDGGFFRLNDPEIPKDLKTHLGYGAGALPFGIVLEKQLEYYIDRKNENLTIPWRLCLPGDFVPLALSQILSRKDRYYAPNGIMATTSGIRSVFMLPNIGSATQHSNLQRDFNVKSPPPKAMSEQWQIFKEIIDSRIIPSNWSSCILHFSEKWVNQIHSNKEWQDIKVYLYEYAWGKSEYYRNKVFYDIIFSVIQHSRNLKPNPYLVDTAQHLFTTALGDAPSFIPATNDDGFPVDVIQQAYVESYGLKKYLPNLMQPTTYIFEKDKYPIYYSLQNPTTYIFSPKSRQISSTLYDLRELEHIVDIFKSEISDDSGIAYGTVMNELAKNIQFRYFHNKSDRHNIIQSSADIPNYDPRFEMINKEFKVSGAKFAADAPFVRGCVTMSTQKD